MTAATAGPAGPQRPTTAGAHRRRADAPAAVLWDVVRRIRTGQRTLPDTVFEVDDSTGVTSFDVGYEWVETRRGRTDRFRVTRHLDGGANGGSYDVFVVAPDGSLARSGTRVTVEPRGGGRSRLRFDALVDAPSPLLRLWLLVARPVGWLTARLSFADVLRRIVATAEREADGSG